MLQHSEEYKPKSVTVSPVFIFAPRSIVIIRDPSTTCAKMALRGEFAHFQRVSSP
jgi:hypothetical protein